MTPEARKLYKQILTKQRKDKAAAKKKSKEENITKY